MPHKKIQTKHSNDQCPTRARLSGPRPSPTQPTPWGSSTLAAGEGISARTVRNCGRVVGLRRCNGMKLVNPQRKAGVFLKSCRKRKRFWKFCVSSLKDQMAFWISLSLNSNMCLPGSPQVRAEGSNPSGWSYKLQAKAKAC